MRRLAALLIGLVLTLTLLVVFSLKTWEASHQGRATGLIVIVTFPTLADDVAHLLCPGDTVVSLVPAGVDPHSYQLRPSDVEKLREAHLVVSTGHAPFEVKIKELCERGELKAVLIEVPRVPGVKLKRNPVTGSLNLHMPIYDPNNYIKFIKHLAKALSSLRPECSEHYESAARLIAERLHAVISRAPKLNVTAVADVPLVQYAVEWMGVRVAYLIEPEHGVPATPQLVAEAEEALRTGKACLAVVVSPSESSASRALLSMARRYSVPVLEVPSPLSKGSVLEKIETVVLKASEIAKGGNS